MTVVFKKFIYHFQKNFVVIGKILLQPQILLGTRCPGAATFSTSVKEDQNQSMCMRITYLLVQLSEWKPILHILNNIFEKFRQQLNFADWKKERSRKYWYLFMNDKKTARQNLATLCRGQFFANKLWAHCRIPFSALWNPKYVLIHFTDNVNWR